MSASAAGAAAVSAGGGGTILSRPRACGATGGEQTSTGVFVFQTSEPTSKMKVTLLAFTQQNSRFCIPLSGPACKLFHRIAATTFVLRNRIDAMAWLVPC
jgi:hypothetical protein